MTTRKFPSSVTVNVCVVFDFRADSFSVKDYFRRIDFDEAGIYKSEFTHLLYISEHELTFPIPPELDPIKAQLDALTEEEKEARAKLAAQLTDITRRRNNLLAIEMDPNVSREASTDYSNDIPF